MRNKVTIVKSNCNIVHCNFTLLQLQERKVSFVTVTIVTECNNLQLQEIVTIEQWKVTL